MAIFSVRSPSIARVRATIIPYGLGCGLGVMGLVGARGTRWTGVVMVVLGVVGYARLQQGPKVERVQGAWSRVGVGVRVRATELLSRFGLHNLLVGSRGGLPFPASNKQHVRDSK